MAPSTASAAAMAVSRGNSSRGAGGRGRRRRYLVGALLMALAQGPACVAATLAERMPACLACHGENGQSGFPETPSLGAQPAPYLLIQIFLFRERLRVVPVMNEAVAEFSDDDLRQFADAIGRMPAPQPPPDGDAARLKQGGELVVKYR